jgi:hypothetical protein
MRLRTRSSEQAVPQRVAAQLHGRKQVRHRGGGQEVLDPDRLLGRVELAQLAGEHAGGADDQHRGGGLRPQAASSSKSFRRGDQPVWRRLIDFWRDNTTQNQSERMINDAIIGWMRMVNRGMLPMFQTSPSSPLVQAISQFVTAGQRREFGDFQALLRRHIEYQTRVAQSAPPEVPLTPTTSNSSLRRLSHSAFSAPAVKAV